METVSIRNLRGESLRKNALKGKPLAITDRGALIAVVIPVAVAWVEHLIDYNWSHVRQSVAESEQAIATGPQLTTIQDMIAGPASPGDGEEQGPEMPERLAVPLVVALTGGTVVQTPESEEVIQRLQTAWNPSGSAAGQEDRPAGPSVITVRIGDLTARLIKKAGGAGQILAITHERELIGIVIPVTQGLVGFLLEQNISRVLYNIGLGEKQLSTPGKMAPLDQVLDQMAPAGPVLPEHDADGTSEAAAFRAR